MASAANIGGQRFERLVAVRAVPKKGWLFLCDCGVSKTMSPYPVMNALVKSCGCLHLERCRMGANRLRHGDARAGRVARLHSIWRKILQRCNPDVRIPQKDYAGRGIKVCPEWQSYEAFRDWALVSGYAAHLSIERINNDGNYEPGNCTWATAKIQARNRRSSKYLEIDGRRQVVAAWLEETGTTTSAFYCRISRGWTPERALGLSA